MVRSRRTNGTSLIEILVVIVVFLVGILAIVQIFPGGFRLLGLTRNQMVSIQLSRAEIERLKGRSDQLPDMILPVSRLYTATDVVITAEPNRTPQDLGPFGNQMDSQGNLLQDGASLGYWRYLSASNVFTRVIGEGRIIPAPRTIGSFYGGLMLLQFSPIVYNSQYDAEFPIYGNDFVTIDGSPGGFIRPYQVFVEDADTNTATIYVPGHPTKAIKYRLAMSAYVNTGSGVELRNVVDAVINVPANPAGGFASFPLSSFAGLQAGETFISVEFESVRVARLFEKVDLAVSFDPNDFYQYKILNPELGLIMFSPYAYNKFVPGRGGRRDPLKARVNYDVYDWSIIRDQFRVPSSEPGQQKLLLSNLKVSGREEQDGNGYNGLPEQIQTPGGMARVDLILLDEDTGGVYMFDPASPVDASRSSYSVDKSIGLIRFQDSNTSRPGLQMMLYYPQTTTPVEVDAPGRSVRALYRANNEYSVQVLKAAAQYYHASAVGGIGTYHLTGLTSGPTMNRIYFPWVDLGRKVTVGEMYYRDGSGNLVGPVDFSSVIRTSANNAVGYPYIDITELDPTAQGFDFTNGYAVRYVKGASVAVRVLWNPNYFRPDSNDVNENYDRYRIFQQAYRYNTTETFLQRGEN
jgi:hypothetical protein